MDSYLPESPHIAVDVARYTLIWEVISVYFMKEILIS